MLMDKFINYMVCINGGSGVIFQPLDKQFSYILTVGHVFDDITSYDSKVEITHFSNEHESGVKLSPFSLIEGENYFKHDNKDICILKIERLDVAVSLSRIDEPNESNAMYYLCGFPGVRRDKTSFKDQMRLDSQLSLRQEKSEGKREARIPGNATANEIIGQSGGGIFLLNEGLIGLLGIQVKVPSKKESLGLIEYYQIKNFDEIVDTFNHELENLQPIFMKCFSSLVSDTFEIEPSLLSKNVVSSLVKILHKMSGDVVNKEITPQSISNDFGKKLLFHGQNRGDLLSKDLWISWLEFLTAISLVKTGPYDFNNLHKKFRLFHSSRKGDFWINHLNDLALTNYSDLEAQGLVIVASDTSTEVGSHDFRDIPEDISAGPKESFDFQNLQINIDDASECPLDIYRFKSISNFKEVTLKENYKLFENLSVGEKLKKIREIYDDLITK